MNGRCEVYNFWGGVALFIASIGRPTRMNAMKYGIMNTPPSYCAARPGNRRKLPSPTALPVTARITPTRVAHDSLLILFGSVIPLR